MYLWKPEVPSALEHVQDTEALEDGALWEAIDAGQARMQTL